MAHSAGAPTAGPPAPPAGSSAPSAPSGGAVGGGVATGPPLRTTPFLTKFEFARIVGLLALQASTSKCASTQGMSPMDAARRAVLEQRAPVVVRRYLPDGSHEDCALQTLRMDLVAERTG
jgi:DNA-directed RNA polymerase I, II, and III subunit RPABC2